MIYYNLHTHSDPEHDTVVAVVNVYPKDYPSKSEYFSVGIHPWYIDQENLESELEIIEKALQDPNCLAIGECGIDKKIETDIELQTQIFERQLLLAEKYQMPVILHCVAAYDELIAMKNDLKITVPLIIHGFAKSPEMAQQLESHGIFLSFGKYLMRNPDLANSLTAVSDDTFLLETDTSEEKIQEVYLKAAEAKNIPLSELHSIIERNFARIFSKYKI